MRAAVPYAKSSAGTVSTAASAQLESRAPWPTILGSAIVAALGGVSCDGTAGSPSSAEAALVGGAWTDDWSGVLMLDQSCSATLVHPELLLYAAHCGTEFEHAIDADGVRFRIDSCEEVPMAAFGGTDLAYCWLVEAADMHETVPPVSGCEVDYVRPGALVHLVGYGDNGRDGFGTKHEGTAMIDAVADEIAVVDDAVHTCGGDSGGPAFIEVQSGESSAFRLAGILSAGASYDCEGISYYTPVAPFVRWLEETTALDVTPCTDASGDWAPTPDCRSHAPRAAVGRSRFGGGLAELCGPAVDLEPVDHVPPVVEISVTESLDATATVMVISADEGWGVREVAVEVQAAGEVVWRRSRAGPSGDLPISSLDPTRQHVVTGIATDFADNVGLSDSVVLEAEPDASNCASAGALHTGEPGSLRWLCLGWIGLAMRRWTRARRPLSRMLARRVGPG